MAWDVVHPIDSAMLPHSVPTVHDSWTSFSDALKLQTNWVDACEVIVGGDAIIVVYVVVVGGGWWIGGCGDWRWRHRQVSERERRMSHLSM